MRMDRTSTYSPTRMVQQIAAVNLPAIERVVAVTHV